MNTIDGSEGLRNTMTSPRSGSPIGTTRVLSTGSLRP
jgi:hypothetical protein